MFDDSKRIDALEKRLNDQIKTFNEWMKHLEEARKQLNENDKKFSENDKNVITWIKRFEEFDRSMQKTIDDMKKYQKGVEQSLVKRVTALEAAMKK